MGDEDAAADRGADRAGQLTNARYDSILPTANTGRRKTVRH